jgi:hypothetical protein
MPRALLYFESILAHLDQHKAVIAAGTSCFKIECRSAPSGLPLDFDLKSTAVSSAATRSIGDLSLRERLSLERDLLQNVESHFIRHPPVGVAPPAMPTKDRISLVKKMFFKNICMLLPFFSNCLPK